MVLGARRGSPLILGVGKGQNFIVSDVSAIVAHTRDVVYLDDYDVVAIERDHFDIVSLAGADASFQVSKVEFYDRRRRQGSLSPLHAQGDF